MRWLWAAYRKGWNQWADAGMDIDKFSETVLETALRVYQHGGEVFVLESKDRGNYKPVGVVATFYVVQEGEVPRAEPHVEWFPWSSARNRIEASLRMLLELERNFLILTTVREGEAGLLKHMVRYGVLRRPVAIPGFYTNGEAAMLFRGIR